MTKNRTDRVPKPTASGNPLALVGRVALESTRQMGDVTLFLAGAVREMRKLNFYGQYFRQCAFVGVDSIPIVLLTAFFTGGVLALQSFNGLNGGSLASSQLGSLVVLSMVRELGPVLAALMVTSRAGAAIAAELASMRVTEQIDALTTLATNPVRFLVAPRILACMTMMPLLVVLANILGILGGYTVGVHVLGVSSVMYVNSTFRSLGGDDITMTLVKGATFGLLIGLMATYHGFKASGGAAGVGVATTRAVVYGAVAILVVDYFITAMFV